MSILNEWLWIDPQHIQFSRDEGGVLVAVWNGKIDAVKVSRLFPITRGESCIRVADLDGNEWGVLRTTSGMEASSRAALSMELRISPYLPCMERISMIRRRFNQFIWEVDTDYGKLSFFTGPIYEAAVNLQNGIRLVTDLEDQRYIVPADHNLDKASRRMLAKWL
ncbi:DUF1854 domain-containing protein [Cohnella sp.]|uniref:DUF1854 domain-containing protein n=1 Tax=Cohnella sp. TaxID=1883426 RepID=UPI00356B6190